MNHIMEQFNIRYQLLQLKDSADTNKDNELTTKKKPTKALATKKTIKKKTKRVKGRKA